MLAFNRTLGEGWRCYVRLPCHIPWVIRWKSDSNTVEEAERNIFLRFRKMTTWETSFTLKARFTFCKPQSFLVIWNQSSVWCGSNTSDSLMFQVVYTYHNNRISYCLKIRLMLLLRNIAVYDFWKVIYIS